MIFFQIARDEEKYGDGRGLHIAEIEPFLRLRQVTEHYTTYRNGLRPIYPVDAFFHVEILWFSLTWVVEDITPIVLWIGLSADGEFPLFTL